MEAAGYLYTARMTNALEEEVPVSYWDEPLITELGTLHELFMHMIRVRNVYRKSLETGNVKFPGDKISDATNILSEIHASGEQLAESFQYTRFQAVFMDGETLTLEEMLNTAVQHEGIHQEQYYVALRQADLPIPASWVRDWKMRGEKPMVKILIMTAVEAEKEAVERGIGAATSIDVAIAGVGPAQAAARTAFALTKDDYDRVLSAGIGGGFKKRAAIGDIVISERLIAAELGAESPTGFIPVDELGFGTNVIAADHSTVQRLSARLVEKNQHVQTGAIATLSTVTGTEDAANALMQRFPDARAEAMEGFGVATAAAEKNLPVVEIRTISNLIGPRDKENWNSKEALASLEQASAAIKEVFA